MKHPNFFIVGAPKCGTTAMSEYLRGHPHVYMSEPKEPHYFAYDFPNHRSVSSLGDYERLFEAAGEQHQAVGEASVYYLFSRAAVEAIYDYDRQARIIVMLRNPVDLVHSLHAQFLFNVEEDQQQFRVAWDLQAERSVGRKIPIHCRTPALLQYRQVGSLGTQLERLYNRFPRCQVRVLVFDDFIADTNACYRSILDFLGIADDGRSDFQVVNVNKGHRSKILAPLAHHPPAQLRRYWLWTKSRLGLHISPGYWLRALNTKTRTKRPLEPELRDELRRVFLPEILKLEALLDRSLSAWHT
jgi:Sulfotransferase domain